MSFRTFGSDSDGDQHGLLFPWSSVGISLSLVQIQDLKLNPFHIAQVIQSLDDIASVAINLLRKIKVAAIGGCGEIPGIGSNMCLEFTLVPLAMLQVEFEEWGGFVEIPCFAEECG